MFIKLTKNQRGEGYYHLVESYREDGKVKQRTLLSLGKVEDGKLEQLSVLLSKYTQTKQIIELSKSIDVKDTYIGNSGDIDHPIPEQIDHPFSWQKNVNFAGKEMCS